MRLHISGQSVSVVTAHVVNEFQVTIDEKIIHPLLFIFVIFQKLFEYNYLSFNLLFSILKFMNIFIRNLSLIIILLSGCTPVKVKMNVDASLQANANIYNLNYPNSLTDKISGKRLNVTFGPYHVTNTDLSWTRTNSRAEDPDPFFTVKNTKTSANTTTTTKVGVGPTEVLGFSRIAEEGEPTIHQSYRTVTYQFNVGKNLTWNARCTHNASERKSQYQNTNATELLSSRFVCQYTPANPSNKETWQLTIDVGQPITLAKNGKPTNLTAHSSSGHFVKANSQTTNHTTRRAGYTWQQLKKNGNAKSVAAISIREEKPRVWLHKDNDNTLNHILAMANTGLWVYGIEIQP